MQFPSLLVLATLLTGAFALPTEKVERACAFTCGTVCYTSSAVSDAQGAGYNLQSSSSAKGGYPHQYHNYENFNFPVSGTYYEFPILKSGSVYSGGSPGADRVVFTGSNELAGLITHTGASGNKFVECT